ncbi:MAG: TrkA family potassium uptake protein, partial [Actinobacteria bacterium]|nr:TrkA family potassium uptake protein [Actinomycetota bacterium]
MRVKRSTGRRKRAGRKRSECSQVRCRFSSATPPGYTSEPVSPRGGRPRPYNRRRVMRVVIAGSGRVGREVAQVLSALGDDVSLLDESEESFELLGRAFDGTLHVGVTYDVDALRTAGIEEADVFLALTPSDNANLMAVQLAERVFGV